MELIPADPKRDTGIPCHLCPSLDASLALGCCAIEGSEHVATVDVCEGCMRKIRHGDIAPVCPDGGKEYEGR